LATAHPSVLLEAPMQNPIVLLRPAVLQYGMTVETIPNAELTEEISPHPGMTDNTFESRDIRVSLRVSLFQ
jgi:hypothetical protein